MKAASIVGGLLLIVLGMSAVLYPWHYPIGYTDPCDTPTITFSELKQENDNGIYVTEVLEIESEESCGLRWGQFYLYLIDDEDLTYYDAIGVDIIDNYSGNNTFHWTQEELSFERNLSAQISNDNGTEFPIHIQNEMTGDREDYNHSAIPGGPRHWLTLSVGDKIKIYGSGSEADGPAKEGWLLRIKYDPTGESVGEIKIS
jgi:hypothetical protein